MKHLTLLIMTLFLMACSYGGPHRSQHYTDEQAKARLTKGKATQYGLFRVTKPGVSQNNPNASTGKVIHGATLEFVKKTDQVPLRKGVSFGYRYWLQVLPEQYWVNLKRVLIHPQITLPDGTKTTRSERNLRKRATHGIVTAIDAYNLSEDYELVEGEWIFQLWYENQKLVEQRFTSYRAEDS